MQDLQAAVIHDVKNQLAELALRLERHGDLALETGIVMAASHRLTGLLLAHREQSGLLRANIDSGSPSDLLEELAVEYRALFPRIAITLGIAEYPSYWFYDQGLLRIALANAVHNACRYAQDSVRLAVRENDGWLEFSVEDDGPGYPPDFLVAATEPAAVTQHGTGLGLYLAFKIAHLHKNKGKTGHIQLENAGGAVLKMRLP